MHEQGQRWPHSPDKQYKYPDKNQYEISVVIMGFVIRIHHIMAHAIQLRYGRHVKKGKCGFSFITTNLVPQQIRKLYGDRIADRLNEMVDKIVFDNPSFRKQREE